jgi:hypothetical protein
MNGIKKHMTVGRGRGNKPFLEDGKIGRGKK